MVSLTTGLKDGGKGQLDENHQCYQTHQASVLTNKWHVPRGVFMATDEMVDGVTCDIMLGGGALQGT